MKKWYRLDNAAQIFPAVATVDNASVFRLAFVLKDKIQPQILQQAVDQIQHRFPTLTVRLRSGMFWHYFDEGATELKVELEAQAPCTKIQPEMNQGYLLKVQYYGHRIAIEVFHSLTDGTGGSIYLESLLLTYLQLKGQAKGFYPEIKQAEEQVLPDELVDSFADYYQPTGKTPQDNNVTALQLTGTPLEPTRQVVVSGCVSANAVHHLAKEAGGTITAYLVANLASAIFDQRMRYRNRQETLVVTIPVNLRKHFPSRTLRNFFSAVPLNLRLNAEMTFSQILDQVEKEIELKTTDDYLQKIVNNYVRLQKNQATRFVPLVIKNALMRVGYHLGDKGNTITLSNLGRTTLPEALHQALSHGEFMLSPDRQHPITCGVWTLNDVLTISFSRMIVETDIIQAFFQKLTQANLAVTVYSSETEVNQ